MSNFIITKRGNVITWTNEEAQAKGLARAEECKRQAEKALALDEEWEKPVSKKGEKKLFEVTACNRIAKSWYKSGKAHSYEKEYFNTIEVEATSMAEAKAIYKSIFSTTGVSVYAYEVYDFVEEEATAKAIENNSRFIVACVLRNLCNGATTASHSNFAESMRARFHAKIADFNVDDMLSVARLAFVEMKEKPVYMAVAYAFYMVNNYTASMAWNNNMAGKITDIDNEAISNELCYFMEEAKQENSLFFRAVASLYRAGQLTGKQAITLFDYIMLIDFRTGSDKASMRMLAKRENINVSSVYKRIAQARYNIARGLFNSRYSKYLPIDIQADKDFILTTLQSKVQAR